MRRIGIVPHEQEAQTFRDYLLTRDIKVQLDAADGGWAVWVYDEDRLDDARKELTTFLDDPQAERYRNAVDEARRKREAELAEDLEARKRSIDLRRKWNRPLYQRIPVTLILIVGSVLATMGSEFGRKLEPVRNALTVTKIYEGESNGGPDYIMWSKRPAEVTQGQVWRLVTPIFLHFSPLHLIMNMYWTYLFGSWIEQRIGTWRFVLLILLTAVPSNLGQFYESGPQFGGMSGVGFGLFGYLWVRGRLDPHFGIWLPRTTVTFFLVWLVICMTGLVGPVANVAHVVGLIAGMGAGGVVAWAKRR
ncbi:Rhomboid protease GlpG [Maioricimonas rarisocia]|uniref:Rhomboid protease GlpG n=1 Tax=Maioricimonas rarisocia TaxID=2528026 RepID=A0A517Z8B9_9PLAN|nr:rhomboid family intramembrane serine protease [Maioricimonas rarisocia]QDU38724.1 Rhomboid protease GlpG [Maioricimonas rarisocia]